MTTKPFYENSRVRVFCGNSLDIVKELQDAGERFDLLLTDPPYGIDQVNQRTSGVNAERGKGMYKDGLFADDDDYQESVVKPIIQGALSISDLGIVTGGVFCYMHYPKPTCIGCMYAPSSPGFNSWGHNDYWPISYYGKPNGNTGAYRKLSHQVTERGFCKSHPCSKPLEFWKKLMLCGTDGIKEKRVLDPFGGSGTTGRAAQDLCMKATIIELNPRYCELIARNCSQETLF